jgi:hypothetical protein
MPTSHTYPCAELAIVPGFNLASVRALRFESLRIHHHPFCNQNVTYKRHYKTTIQQGEARTYYQTHVFWERALNKGHGTAKVEKQRANVEALTCNPI